VIAINHNILCFFPYLETLPTSDWTSRLRLPSGSPGNVQNETQPITIYPKDLRIAGDVIALPRNANIIIIKNMLGQMKERKHKAFTFMLLT
jgi:hypothetical protein